MKGAINNSEEVGIYSGSQVYIGPAIRIPCQKARAYYRQQNLYLCFCSKNSRTIKSFLLVMALQRIGNAYE